MKKTAWKRMKVFCGAVAMLAILAGILPIQAYAAVNGIYTATATPHYKHPETGIIEDSGGEDSAVLGQSMTESALYEQALVEVDPDGKTFITLRMQLMESIQNPEFQADGEVIKASLMQEDYTNNTADYRIAVENENSIIRCNMYVTPMGREVIFYITVSDLTEGSADFITSVQVVEGGKSNSADGETDRTQTAATEKPDTSNTEDKEEAFGLQEYDAEGNQVTSEQTETENTGISGPVFLIGGTVMAVIIAALVWFFCMGKKK